MKRRLIAAVVATALAGAAAATALAQVYGSGSDPNKLRAGLSGAREVPGPGDSNGSGNANITLKPRTKRVCFSITFSRIGRPGAGHIHMGGRRVAGDIVVPLFESANGVTSPHRGCEGNVRRGLIRDIREHPDRFYVNLHTRAFPDGAIRGQLRRR
jgi:CHRD domain